jgi:hypothetical protein
MVKVWPISTVALPSQGETPVCLLYWLAMFLQVSVALGTLPFEGSL